ncbi:hypothetical protein [Paraburkholderia sp. JHI869]|uniref:hypothetical protein n=1 Tax=Paraburkholderia sp. JHI869 TaxID=3112959 RepID=UPI00316CBBC4
MLTLRPSGGYYDENGIPLRNRPLKARKRGYSVAHGKRMARKARNKAKARASK